MWGIFRAQWAIWAVTRKKKNAKSKELIKLAIVTAPDLEILVNESTLPLSVAHLVILTVAREGFVADRYSLS